MQSEVIVAQIVGGIIVVEAIKYLAVKYIKKADADYKTVEDCARCRKECQEVRDRQGKEDRRVRTESDNDIDRALSEIRGILLVVALKSGVPPEELRDLTR